MVSPLAGVSGRRIWRRSPAGPVAADSDMSCLPKRAAHAGISVLRSARYLPIVPGTRQMSPTGLKSGGLKSGREVAAPLAVKVDEGGLRQRIEVIFLQL